MAAGPHDRLGAHVRPRAAPPAGRDPRRLRRGAARRDARGRLPRGRGLRRDAALGRERRARGGGVPLMDDGLTRCRWAYESERMRVYHDTEWGVPTRDSRELFELLLLEGVPGRAVLAHDPRQARALPRGHGRLRSREDRRLRRAQARASCWPNPGIVRNRLKVRRRERNARAYLDLVDEQGDFATWVWSFVGGDTLRRDAPLRAGRGARHDARGRGHVEGPQARRLHLRRPHDRLRVHAERRAGR